MPSYKNIAAAAAALVGLASAIPSGGYTYGNATANAIGGTAASTGATALSTGSAVSANTTSSAAASATAASNQTRVDDSLFCPNLNLEVFIDPKSISYIIECNTNHFGIIIDVTISLAKRQTTIFNLGDCIDLCDDTTNCVATSLNTATGVCTLYSEIGAAYTDANSDFAVVVSSDAASTVAAGATATSTLYSTNVVTIASCAPTVTDCPLRAGVEAVVTQVVAVQSTEYICPTASVVPAAPVACGCAYSVSTAQAYSATISAGSTILVPVTSTVIAVPQPTATIYSVTAGAATVPVTAVTGAASAVVTTAANGALTTVYPAVNTAGAYVAGAASASGAVKGSATTSSGLAVFTGAASNLKAGMGMGAVVAAAALLL